MDTSNHHNLRSLFDQLGLASKPAQIDAFIKNHKLNNEVRIENADFWSDAQASFIHEAIIQDSDWTALVDQLDTLLRNEE